MDIILTGVQQALISGTNIKTVGGESLLGAGDIPISAVSDFFGELQLSATNAGDKYFNLFRVTACVFNSNAFAASLRFFPFIIPKDTTFNSLTFRVGANVAGSTLRVGIFSNQNNHVNSGVTCNIFPNAPLLDTGAINTATAGQITVSISPLSLTKNTIYWLAVVGSNSPNIVNIPATACRFPFINIDPTNTAKLIGTAGTAVGIGLFGVATVGAGTAFDSIANGYPTGGIYTERVTTPQTLPCIILGY